MRRPSSSIRKKNKLFVISGPSGSGKGTLIKRLLKERIDLDLSVSATTRKPRACEVDKKDYYFIKEEAFLEKISKDEFLEWARVHGFLYGTLKSEIEKILTKKHHAILEIDPQGASQVKEKRPESILIFIKPPSLKSLKERLHKRGTEKEEAIKQRIYNAKNELKQVDKYRYVIINDSFNKASLKLNKIIKKESEK